MKTRILVAEDYEHGPDIYGELGDYWGYDMHANQNVLLPEEMDERIEKENLDMKKYTEKKRISGKRGISNILIWDQIGTIEYITGQRLIQLVRIIQSLNCLILLGLSVNPYKLNS